MQRPEVPVSVKIPISKDLYYPSAGKLRAAYVVNSLSGKTTALDRIIELGNALNRAYPDGDRAPDDFISLEVGMSMSEMKELELEPLANEDILKKPAIGSLIETLQELKNNSHEGTTIDIDLTIKNIPTPISQNEPRVVGLIEYLQEYYQSKNTQQIRLDEFLSKLETTNSLPEPTVVVSTSRSKNLVSSDRAQVDDRNMSMQYFESTLSIDSIAAVQ